MRTDYPIARAAVAALLGEAPAAPGAATELAPFTIGAAVLRPPPAVFVPPPTAEATGDDGDDGDRADALLGELVDMVLVGDGGAAGGDLGAPAAGAARHEVHLVFKAEVLGGLHLRLQRRPAGLFCTFLVDDANARRMVDGHADELLVRLRARGFKVSGHEVQVRGRPGPE